MKRLLAILLVLILLCVAAVWLAPVLVDFNVFRQDIAKQISTATGRDVTIDGDISLKLIPEPSIQVHQVSVRNSGAAKDSPAAIAVDELRLNAEFWPLLNKQIKLTSVHFVKPEIRLAELGPADMKQQAETPATEGEDLIAAVSLDAVKIIDGRIQVSDTLPEITKINAELRAPTLTGPFSISGSIGLGELALAMDLTTGRLGEGQALPVELTLMTQDTLNSASYNGVVNIQGDSGAEGNFQLSMKDPAATAAKAGFAGMDPLGMFNSMAARGVVSYTPQQTKLSGLELTLDESKLSAEILYTPDHDLQIEVQGDELDISSLSGSKSGSKDSLFKTLDHTDLPRMDMAVFAKTAFKKVINGKTAYENVDAEFSLKDGALTVSKFNATLPGSTKLAIKGNIKPEGVRETAVLSNFDAAIELVSKTPQNLLSGLGIEDAPAITKPVSFLGRVQGMTNGVKFQDAVVKYGDSEVTFTGSYVDSDPARIELVASCKALELPTPANEDKGDADIDLGWLKKNKINFDLSCASLTRGQAVMRDVRLKGTGDAEGLRLSEPSGFAIDRLKLSTQGRIGKLSPLGSMDIKVALKGQGLADALGKLGVQAGDWARTKLFSDIDVMADYTGDMKNAAFSVKGDLSGIDLQLGGTAEDLQGDIAFDGKIRLQHQDAAKAVSILLPDTKPPGKIYGNLDLYTELKGDKDKFSMNAITGKIGDITISGKADIDLEAKPVAVDATMQTTTVDLNKLGVTSASGGGGNSATAGQWSMDNLGRVVPNNVNADLHLTMDGLVYGKTKLDKVAAVAALKNGVLNLSQLDARAFGGRMGITGTVDQAQTDKLNADIDIMLSSIQSLQLFKTLGLGDAVDGEGDVTVKLATAGQSERALVSNLNGAVTYLSQGGTLNGVDLERVSDRLEELTTQGKISAQLLKALEGGKTAYETAQADIQFKNGVGIIKTGEVVTASGNITGRGQIDLPKWRLNIDGRIKLLRPEGIPALDMTLKGPLHSPQKQLGTDLISQFLAEKFARQLEQKFFNKGQDPNAPDSQDSQPKQDNKFPIRPEDAIKNILKNL